MSRNVFGHELSQLKGWALDEWVNKTEIVHIFQRIQGYLLQVRTKQAFGFRNRIDWQMWKVSKLGCKVIRKHLEELRVELWAKKALFYKELDYLRQYVDSQASMVVL